MYNKPEGGLIAWLQFLDATTAAQVRTACCCLVLASHPCSIHP